MDITWISILIYICFLLIAGYTIPVLKNKTLARFIAWTLAVATVAISTFATADQSPLIRMLIIVSMQLLSMKVVVMAESYSSENRLTLMQWFAFSLGWFGMRPALFERLPSARLDYLNIALKGFSRILIGFMLLYLSRVTEAYSVLSKIFIPSLLMLAGVSMILHFGFLNLSTAGWRMLGVDVSELFKSPYRSKSLKEFWGRRWNLAFSEMTALIAYRPLKSKVGVEKAVILSFLLSGLLHEIAISFPVRAGYGLPMLYFAIHATAMQLETNSPIIKRIIAHPVLSHVWVMALLVLPMPLLFHDAFIEEVLIPMRSVLLLER